MQIHIRTSNVIVVLASFLFTLVAPRLAAADTLTLMWDANPAPEVAGYIAHVGTQSGTYTQHFTVGQATTFTFSTAVAGQRYCFAVSSYATGPLEGAKSGEVCGYSNASPLLVNPGARQSTVGQASSLQLAGSDPDGQPVTYSATGVPSGLVLMASTGFISGTPTSAGSNTVTATVSDGLLTASQAFTWTIVGAPDTTAPTVTIAAPTSAATYVTTSATATLSGTASDNVAVTQVTWVNNRGGSGTATGTTNWSTGAITLQTGANVLTMTSRDAAGNTGSAVLTVTRNAAADTSAPTVTIAAPTSAATYVTTSATATLSGTASDNVAVTQVTWVNNRGGSGTATGTTNWSTGAITLQTGANVLTMTSRDAAGNTGSAVLTVTRNAAADTSAPTVTIAAPTSAATYVTTSATATLSGTASDNVAVTQVTWVNNRGGSGTATGTTNWSTGAITLQTGANVLTMTSRDAAGNTGSAVLTVTRNAAADTSAPTVTIAAPTSAATYVTTSATATLSGTASDNVAVTQVTWVNNRGGSGTATGTTTWSTGAITLQTGANVLTMTSRDAAGNTGSAVLTVTRNAAADTSAPTVTITEPTSSPYAVTTASVSLRGTAADNVGVTRVTWANDRGASGTFTGTASWSVWLGVQPGVNVITVTAFDAAGNTATGVITMTRDTTPTLASVSSRSTNVGQAVSLQLAGADADGNVLTYSAIGLPAGLTLNASDGLISGSPTTIGSNAVTVSVSDGALFKSQTFTWTIKP